MPIGASENGSEFMGTYDGGDYNIYNLTINNSSAEYIGLFGYAEGLIKNVNIKNCNIQIHDKDTGYYVGSIAGCGWYLFNCTSEGVIKVSNVSGVTAGGIAGHAWDYYGENKGALYCQSNVEIKVDSGGAVCGGIAGEGSVIGSKNLANIDVTTNSNVYCGGIVGDSAIVYDSVNYGTIKVECMKKEPNYGKYPDFAAGGIAGLSLISTIRGCVNYGDVIAESKYQDRGGWGASSGGIVGAGYRMKCTDCCNLGLEINADEYVGRVIGFTEIVDLDNLYSLEDARVNGERVYSETTKDWINGESMERESMSKHINPVLKQVDWKDNRLIWDGHEYNAFPAYDRDWKQSKEFCESVGGYLATISSIDENKVLFEKYMKDRHVNVFFGLVNFDGTWRWLNGEEVIYTNWNADMQKNGTFAKFCLESNDGTWESDSDNSNAFENYFICEWEKPIINEYFVIGKNTNYFPHNKNIFIEMVRQ